MTTLRGNKIINQRPPLGNQNKTKKKVVYNTTGTKPEAVTSNSPVVRRSERIQNTPTSLVSKKNGTPASQNSKTVGKQKPNQQNLQIVFGSFKDLPPAQVEVVKSTNLEKKDDDTELSDGSNGQGDNFKPNSADELENDHDFNNKDKVFLDEDDKKLKNKKTKTMVQLKPNKENERWRKKYDFTDMQIAYVRKYCRLNIYPLCKFFQERLVGYDSEHIRECLKIVQATDQKSIMKKFPGIQSLFKNTIEGKRNYAVTRLKEFTTGKLIMH